MPKVFHPVVLFQVDHLIRHHLVAECFSTTRWVMLLTPQWSASSYLRQLSQSCWANANGWLMSQNTSGQKLWWCCSGLWLTCYKIVHFWSGDFIVLFIGSCSAISRASPDSSSSMQAVCSDSIQLQAFGMRKQLQECFGFIVWPDLAERDVVHVRWGCHWMTLLTDHALEQLPVFHLGLEHGLETLTRL